MFPFAGSPKLQNPKKGPNKWTIEFGHREIARSERGRDGGSEREKERQRDRERERDREIDRERSGRKHSQLNRWGDMLPLDPRE